MFFFTSRKDKQPLPEWEGLFDKNFFKLVTLDAFLRMSVRFGVKRHHRGLAKVALLAA
jgi:hypothetical protein